MTKQKKKNNLNKTVKHKTKHDNKTKNDVI